MQLTGFLTHIIIFVWNRVLKPIL